MLPAGRGTQRSSSYHSASLALPGISTNARMPLVRLNFPQPGMITSVGSVWGRVSAEIPDLCFCIHLTAPLLMQ